MCTFQSTCHVFKSIVDEQCMADKLGLWQPVAIMCHLNLHLLCPMLQMLQCVLFHVHADHQACADTCGGACARPRAGKWISRRKLFNTNDSYS